MNFRLGLIRITLLFAVLLAATWVLMRFQIDFWGQNHFYSETAGWLYKSAQPWKWIHDYGTVPGLLLCLGAMAGLVVGLWKKSWGGIGRPLLQVLLTALLGAGLLANVILKPYCGRPRPRDIQNYGGQWEYCAPCTPANAGKGQSFPCGHCTMGYLFVTLFFFWPHSRLLAVGGGTFGLLYGTLVGVGRAAQGAHFVTDALWSFGVIIITATALHHWVIPQLTTAFLNAGRLSRRRKAGIAGATVIIALGITAGFLTRRPYYDTHARQIALSPAIRQVIIETNTDLSRHAIKGQADPDARLRLHSQGFGWISSTVRIGFDEQTEGPVLRIQAMVTPTGYFADLSHQIDVWLPHHLKNRVKILTNKPS